MSEAKKWRELRRDVRRAKTSLEREAATLALANFEKSMNPKQLQKLREEHECSGPTVP